MANIPDIVITVAEGATLFGLYALFQSTVIIGLGLLGCFIIREKSAVMRSILLRTTLVAAIACPTISFIVDLTDLYRPPAEVPGLSLAGLTHHSHTDNSIQDTEISAIVEPIQPSGEADGQTAASLFAGNENRFASYVGALIGTALLGVSACLIARFLLACGYLRRLRQAASCSDDGLGYRCRQLADTLNVSPPMVGLSMNVKTPCLVGFIHPVILLPENSAMLQSGRQQILLHELAHLRRGDHLWLMLCRLVMAILFFQPLLGILVRRLEQAADEACDDMVIDRLPNRHSYANLLVHLAKQQLGRTPELTYGLGVVTLRSGLGQRVKRILDSRQIQNQDPSGRMTVALTLPTFILVIFLNLVGIEGGEHEKPRPEVLAAMPLEQDILGDPTLMNEDFSGDEERPFHAVGRLKEGDDLDRVAPQKDIYRDRNAPRVRTLSHGPDFPVLAGDGESYHLSMSFGSPVVRIDVPELEPILAVSLNPVVQFDSMRYPGSVNRMQSPFVFFPNIESISPTGVGEGGSDNLHAAFFVGRNRYPLSLLNATQRSEIGAGSPWQLHPNDRLRALHSEEQVLLLQVDLDNPTGEFGFTGLAELPPGILGNWPIDTSADGLTLDGIDWISPGASERDTLPGIFGPDTSADGLFIVGPSKPEKGAGGFILDGVDGDKIWSDDIIDLEPHKGDTLGPMLITQNSSITGSSSTIVIKLIDPTTQGVPPATAHTPEPATLSLLILGSLILPHKRRA
jgi:beta-lactamase regulating signal transducer with metallopeptidase domain